MTREVPTGDADAVLEFAAQLCEQMMADEIAGVWSKKKRVREDAALRGEAMKDARLKCAATIRAFKSRPDLDPVNVLRRLAERGSRPATIDLRDAWPLAWKGWLDINVTVCCTSRSLPPEAGYTITITEKGRMVLDGAMAPTD